MQNLKSLIAITTVLTVAGAPAYAERNQTHQALVESGTFTAATLAGVVLGGPAGMLLGASAGAFLAQETRKANDYAEDVDRNEDRIQETEELMMHQQQVIDQLQSGLADALTMDILFATGRDVLTDLDLSKLERLADHLHKHPGLQVKLNGHTDLRGSDEYNNVLAIERARAVQRALVELGIAASRIATHGYGSQFAAAASGDPVGLARDRRVEVELLQGLAQSGNLAQH